MRNISNKTVLNLGYGGTGPLIQYATLREYLKPNVKNVIWFYYEGNDLNNLRNELNSDILRNYLDNYKFTQKLRLKQNLVDSIISDYINFNYNKINRFYLMLKENLFHLIKIENTNKKNQDSVETLTYFSSIISLAKKASYENNSNFYFVYLPEINRYKNKNYFNNSYKEIKKIIKDLKIPFIDIDEEVFKDERNVLEFYPFKQFPHYTVQGYNKIAKSILKFF